MILHNSETPRRRARDHSKLPFPVSVYAQDHRALLSWDCQEEPFCFHACEISGRFCFRKDQGFEEGVSIGWQPHKFILHIVFAFSIQQEDFSQFSFFSKNFQ
jgi:hypothetical protein